MRCVDCPVDARLRPVTRPGPRCATHQRERRKRTSTQSWERSLRNKFGITPDQYWALYDAQGRVCYGCQRATGRTTRLAVDHDHKTGKIRGLLCRLCNRDVLGHFGDDPRALRRLADYCENPPAFAVIGEVVVPGGPD